MQTTRVFPVTVLILAAALVGCQGPAYVNIPPQKGDVASHNPNGRTVRAVVVAVIDAVIQQTPLDGPVALGLPEGAEMLTYEAVADLVASEVVPAPPADEAEAGTMARLSVTQVRVRGNRAEVDAVRAAPGADEQLVTATASWDPFGGWHVERIRPWRIPVPDAAR